MCKNSETRKLWLLAFGVPKLFKCTDRQTIAVLGDFCKNERERERERARKQDRTISDLLSRCFLCCLILGSDLEQKMDPQGHLNGG